MQFLRAVEANPNTKVVANWYRTTPAEHTALLAEKAALLYIWPVASHAQKVWWGRAAAPHPHGIGDFQLTSDFGRTCFISFDAPGTQPILF